MSNINAFIGHSFTEDDEAVVQAFLKYFDQVKNLFPAFDWVHAKAAQPTELADKVLKLVEDCNTFIGICTRKEIVSQESSYRVKRFDSQNRIIKYDKLQWKTSDWIIQEIGMAAGQRMSIICLLENDCRRPSGLQGDVEFITFDRNAPEKAFGKLLEMIEALSPTTRSVEAATTEGTSERITEVPEPAQTDGSGIPDVSWDLEKYQNAFLSKLINKDAKGAEEIEAAYLETAEGREEEKAAEWRAWLESWRIFIGQGGSLEKIKELSVEFPDNIKIITELANVLSKFEDNLGAAKKYSIAADKSEDEIEEAQRLRRLAALQFARAGKLNQAETILSKQRAWVCSKPDHEFELLSTFRQLAEIKKDDDLLIEVMERVVKIKPDDYDTRFSLAYNHSNNGNRDLALHHYLQIPWAERSAMVWNNLGVSFENFSMPEKAVQAYRKSASEGETLAMSNLGNKLMQAGFTAEAGTEFDKAIKIEDFHRNVGEGITALRDISEHEAEKESKTLEKARDKIAFYQLLGKAIVQPDIKEISSNWRGPVCDLFVTITDNKFRAVGEYERQPNALGSGLLATKTTRHKVEYIGALFGRRAYGTIKRRSLDDNPEPLTTALGSAGIETNFLLIINEGLKKISIMENPTSTSPKFYDLNSITNS